MMTDNEPTTVLIVEDEVDNLTLVSRLLELEDYRILQAGDGEEGLRLAGENHPDVAVLDIRLPKIDGWTLLGQIKNDPDLSNIRIIVFSASAGPDQQARAMSMGADAYIVKPADVSTLRETVTKVLHEKGRN